MTGPHARAAIACVLTAALILVVKVYATGVSHLRAADRAAEARDVALETQELSRAARWSLAGVGPAHDALDRLDVLAKRLGEEGRAAESLAAYEELAAAVHATRSLFGEDRVRLARARRAVAEIRYRDAVGAAAASPEAYLAATEPRSRVHEGWALVASLAFVGWIGAGVALIARGMTPDLRLRPRAAAPWAGWLVGLYALWLGALWMA